MSLRDELSKAQPVRRGPKCSICRLLIDLPEDDRDALEEALDSYMPSTVIHRAIAADGHRVGRGSVGRHRRGDCKSL